VALTEIVKSGIPALVLAEGVFSGRETVSKTKFLVIAQLCCGILLTAFGDLHNSSFAGLLVCFLDHHLLQLPNRLKAN
jgi:drug/metabolite transporter (DMT)-like permease